tara:strand:- start:4025 stop:4624 length:600 start_codon:yes stop_codon:yes gene_type:complete
MKKEQELDQLKVTIEELLWKDLKKGNLSALGSLYELHVDRLFVYGCKISGDREVIQDEIHNLFLDLYTYHKKLSDVKNIEGYLIISLKRKLYKSINYNIRSIEDELETLLDVNADNGLTVDSYEEEIIEDENENELLVRLQRIMANLTDHQQKILHLRFTKGKSYEQISDDLGLSVASTRTLIYRTLKSIRKTALTLFF